MLIEFSVKNFRSIKDRQTLSMVASNRDKSLPDRLIDPQVKGLSNTKLLKSAAIYGANASGKSNIFKAMQFMRDFVVKSATDIKPGQETGIVPFRLDAQTETEPSEFEIIFIHEGVRYQYGFVLDKRQVYEEWLTAYPTGKPQQWFTRVWDKENNEYEWKFSTFLKGEKEGLKEKTRENALFLSTAAQWNNQQIKNIYESIDYKFHFYDFSDKSIDPINTIWYLESGFINKDYLSSLLTFADIGISGIEFERKYKDRNHRSPNTTKEEIYESHPPIDYGHLEFQLKHKGNKIETLFDQNDESKGTIKYLSILGPILFAIEQGYALFIDEIGANLHPLLLNKILELINRYYHPEFMPQLIFTTHDTTQLNQDTLRRDQIWFTEKNEEGATILYPLTDFKPRQDESLQKGYLAGRYGAIPYLGDFKF